MVLHEARDDDHGVVAMVVATAAVDGFRAVAVGPIPLWFDGALADRAGFYFGDSSRFWLIGAYPKKSRGSSEKSCKYLLTGPTFCRMVAIVNTNRRESKMAQKVELPVEVAMVMVKMLTAKPVGQAEVLMLATVLATTVLTSEDENIRPQMTERFVDTVYQIVTAGGLDKVESFGFGTHYQEGGGISWDGFSEPSCRISTSQIGGNGRSFPA
jgi:hypothetical protein